MSQRLRSGEGYDALLHKLLDGIDINSDASVLDAITKLRNDEHIQAATRARILDIAFVLSLEDHDQTRSVQEEEYLQKRFGATSLDDRWVEDSDAQTFTLELPETLELADVPEPEPPFTYIVPDSRCFITGTNCLPDCPRMTHDDDCRPRMYDSVLSDAFLDGKLAEAYAMARSAGIDNIEDRPFILDIDLDYFHTRSAVNPTAKATFLRLVRNCAAITIAMEPDFVSDLQLAGEDFTAEYLLGKIEALILEAQG